MHTIVTTQRPGGKQRMEWLMKMMASGSFDPTPLITHRFSLEEIGEAYRVFSNAWTAC
jgi:threonine dehydrogenase-like Zn-dependent dehydrogenase